PVAVHGNGAVTEVEFAYTTDGPDGLMLTDQHFRLRADQVFRAIGQRLTGTPEGLLTEGGKITIDETGRTSVPGIWAGGDCAAGGDDLTVTAVAQGRNAAEDIDARLAGRPADTAV
ncbi:MAG: FAD-dependent oxidoreductase, partial [Paracoccus sp. (in: a-proteobacteria)]